MPRFSRSVVFSEILDPGILRDSIFARLILLHSPFAVQELTIVYTVLQLQRGQEQSRACISALPRSKGLSTLVIHSQYFLVVQVALDGPLTSLTRAIGDNRNNTDWDEDDDDEDDDQNFVCESSTRLYPGLYEDMVEDLWLTAQRECRRQRRNGCHSYAPTAPWNWLAMGKW